MQKIKSTTASREAAHIPAIPNTPVRFLWYVSRNHKKWMFLAIFFAGLAAIIGQSSNIFFKWIIDAVESGDKAAALRFGLLFPLVLLLIQSMYRLSGWCGLYWIAGVQKTASDDLFGYTVRHSHQYFSDRFAGSLLSKQGNVVMAMDSLISGFLWSHFNAFLSFLVTFIFILVVDPLSSALFLALVIVLVWSNIKWMPKKRELSKVNAAAGTKLRGHIVDVYTNMMATRQYVQRNAELKRESELSTDWVTKRKANWLYTERTLFYNSLILAGFGMAIMYSLVERWRVDTITTADFIFILALVSSLSGTLIFIGRAMTDTARSFGEAEEGIDELLLPLEISDDENASQLSATAGEIVWKDVTFEFGENRVFDNFNVTIKPGERIGLVGPSGAGKTTFVSLLLRQHDIDDGAILIDGQNIAEVTQDSLREAIAVVPQEPLLFHRSIRDNIAYGKPEANQEEIIKVAKKAQAHDFIVSLPEGYDTLVGERGVKLSGGQKQRVAIARAMLKNAPILVLDEATSALDSESEVAIQQALETLMEGKTVIAVAHRLSTLREMDRILVLEQGQIVEDGSHAELTQNGGTYQRLWEHQAGGFLQE